MHRRRWIVLPCLAALALFFANAAAATMIGKTVGVTLTDGGSLNASDSVVVGSGPEITPGDGSSVGALLLPNETVDLAALTIDLVLEEGAANGTTGYGPGTRYLFSNLSFLDPSLVVSGVTISLVNVTGVVLGSQVTFGPDFVSLLIDTLVIGDIPNAVDVGRVTLTLQTAVPEPDTAVLVACGLGVLAFGRRGRSPARA